METDNLRHVMAAYFHQDWPLEYPNWQTAVDDFVDRSPARADLVPDEIGNVLDHHASEESLVATLTQLGAFIHAPSLGCTYGEWLSAVQDRVRTRLAVSPMVAYPALEQFAGGQFHQDWMLDYADERDALADFVEGQPELLGPLARELESLLTRDLTEHELVRVLEAHGADHVPRGPDGTVRSWLVTVHAEVART